MCRMTVLAYIIKTSLIVLTIRFYHIPLDRGQLLQYILAYQKAFIYTFIPSNVQKNTVMGLFGGSESSSSNAGAGKGAEGDNVENGKQALIEKAPRSPYRPLYIMVWSSALFKAHWSFWAPALEGRQRTKGKRAHAIGNVRDGFAIEFVRNYDLSVTRSYPTIIEIGAIRIEDLLDTLIDGQHSRDNTPWDRFEAIALSVPAPRASLNQVNEQPCTSEASQQVGRNAGPVGSSRNATEESSRVSHDISESCISCN